MFRFKLVSLALVVFAFSHLSYAGDCNKTVMGGGCTAEAEAGVAAHMRSQPKAKPVVAKEKAAEPNVKQVSMPTNVKMSKTANQKPQI